MRGRSVVLFMGPLLGGFVGCFAYPVPGSSIPLDPELRCIFRADRTSFTPPRSCNTPDCRISDHDLSYFQFYLGRSELLRFAEVRQGADVEVQVKSFRYWRNHHCPNILTILSAGLLPSFCSTYISGQLALLFPSSGKIVSIPFESTRTDSVAGWLAAVLLLTDDWGAKSTFEEGQIALDVALNGHAAEIKSAASVWSCSR